jgi:hypothetical protein
MEWFWASEFQSSIFRRMHEGLEEPMVNSKEKKEYFRIIISKTTS